MTPLLPSPPSASHLALATLAVVVAAALALVAAFELLRCACFRRGRAARAAARPALTVAFFHPAADGGGGGERVLWAALQALAEADASGSWVGEGALGGRGGRAGGAGARGGGAGGAGQASSAAAGGSAALRPRARRGSGSAAAAASAPMLSPASTPPRRPLRLVVYAAPGSRAPAEVIARAGELFGLRGLPAVEFVPLPSARLLSPAAWPRLTLLGQSLGGALVAAEAMAALVPDVFIDTTGAPFAAPVAAFAGAAAAAAYVHYPSISSDMLAKVAARRPDYNNAGAVARSPAATAAKLAYYRAFAALYAAAGRAAGVVLANSSWTAAHVDAMWGLPAAGRPAARVLPPPCNTAHLATLPLGGRLPLVLSVGQFRPEKDHALQLRAFAAFRAAAAAAAGGGAAAAAGGARAAGARGAGAGARTGSARARAGPPPPPPSSSSSLPPPSPPLPRLVLAGGARDAGDLARVASLEALARELGLSVGAGRDVEFVLNAPLPALRALLGSAAIGLHTMWNEHFGISVVEMMAAGALTIAHDSGGPKADIVRPWGARRVATGFLADGVDGFAHALARAWALHGEGEGGGPAGGGARAMAAAARESVLARFSDDAFRAGFADAIAPALRAAAAAADAADPRRPRA